MSVSFETLALAKRYTQEAVVDAIGGVTKIDFRFVETLPLVGEAGTIYCVPVNSDDASDLYDEYYYINGHFERLPGARIDLTPYAMKNWVTGEGYYKKPVDGIPGTDLDAATRATLAKAETALQDPINEVEVSATEPTDPNVELWLYQNPGEKIEIPTMKDFRDLQSALDDQVIAAVNNWLDENLEIGDNVSY